MMRKNTLLAAFVLGIVIVLPCVTMLVTAVVSPTLFRHLLNPGDRYIYGYNSRTEDVGGVAVDEAHGTVLYGDVAQNAKFCNSDSGYKCVDGAGFHFAVPYELKDDKTVWAIDGYQYQMRRGYEIEDIDGHRISVVVIDSKESPELAWTYYYSPAWGLLAFEQKSNDRVIRRAAIGCFGFGGTRSGSLVRYLLNRCWNTDATR